MMKRIILSLIAAASFAKDKQPVQAVPSVDLNRYAGKWFELARYPNAFEKKCVANTTATYTLRSDGKITVLNDCDDSKHHHKSIKGTAHLANPKGPNSKLKVSFFGPFSGDYWIIGLDPNYEWAIVGTPKRNYLWFLTRQSHISDELYNHLSDLARQQGFDPARLVKTPQQ